MLWFIGLQSDMTEWLNWTDYCCCCFCGSVAKSCLTLWSHEMQHTRLLCHRCLPEFPQTYVHRVSDTIQPSHLLSPPSPLALNFSQHQGLSQWVGSFASEPVHTHSWPSASTVSVCADSTNCGSKKKKNIFLRYQKVSRSKTWNLLCRQLFIEHLHCIYHLCSSSELPWWLRL